MTRRRALRLTLTVVAAGTVVVLMALVVLAQVFLRRPFPDYDGETTLTGLDDPVRVVRDGQGIPHIYAGTSADLFRAMGYVHAQDRFFEMDLRRRVTAGRLAELVGGSEQAIASDMLVRTMGWRRVAEQEMSLLSAATRNALESYAGGVNAYLGERGTSELSVNYTILSLGHELPRIERWTPVDSLAWLKALAWDLKTNYANELDRARDYASVRDVARVNQLFPPYPFDRHEPVLSTSQVQAASSVPASSGRREAAASTPAPSLLAALRAPSAQAAITATASALAGLPRLVEDVDGDGIGSNAWVVSGRYTASGKPLLANDPHLAVSIPSTWYQVGLHCTTVGPQCPYDVTGFSMSGLPGVIIGHNGSIAWGVANMNADSTDFYLEQVSDSAAAYDGRREPLSTRQETIKVADGDPVTITVRSSVHGPLLSDVVNSLAAVGRGAPASEPSATRGGGYEVALAWTALTPNRSMDALLRLGAATTFEEFRSAVAPLAAPALNFVYADTAGHIGYQAAGLVPVRSGTSQEWPVPIDGSWPLPGWDASYDWSSFVPADALPWALDVDEGFIVSANQAVVPAAFGVRITSDWDYGYRSQRIRTSLTDITEAGGLVTADDMAAIQTDTRNPIAPELVPFLLRSDVNAFTAQARDLLRDWQPEYTQEPESAAAAYFNAVWASLLQLTFFDELPDGARPGGGARWFEVVRNLLEDPEDPWWDDRGTPSVVETRDEIVRRALVRARLRLTRDLGKDPERWQWGRLHSLELQHKPLGGEGVPGLVHRLVNRGPLAAPGGSAAVNSLAWDASSGTFTVTTGPSMRMIVDLSDLDASRWVNQTGNSAHPSDDHYDDQLETWLAGGTLPWPFSTEAVEAARDHELRLQPGGRP